MYFCGVRLKSTGDISRYHTPSPAPQRRGRLLPFWTRLKKSLFALFRGERDVPEIECNTDEKGRDRGDDRIGSIREAMHIDGNGCREKCGSQYRRDTTARPIAYLTHSDTVSARDRRECPLLHADPEGSPESMHGIDIPDETPHRHEGYGGIVPRR